MKKRIISFVLSLAMLLSTLVVPAVMAEGTKYTIQTTADGWIKVIQKGGPTLGYFPDSGVTLLEDNGFAFKDLNKNGKLDIYEDWRLDAYTRARDLVSQMSIEEELPLMLLAEYDFDYSKGSIEGVIAELESGMKAIAAPFALGAVKYAVQYNNDIQKYSEATTYGIPVEICAETNADVATIFPNNLSLSATFDPALLAKYAQIISQEYRTIGISGMMTPQTDLATEPRWSRITGTFGEDPQLSADMVTQVVNGLQSTYDNEGNDLGWGNNSIITQVKHFPGDGAAEGGREAHRPEGKYNVYPGDNFYTHLIPFQATLELPGLTGSAVGIMPSYSIAIDEDGEPFDDEAVASGFSHFKLTEILREKMGFDGVISSDFVITLDGGDNRLGGRIWGVENLTVAERKLLSIEVGMDRFGGESDVEGMKEAYQLGVGKYGEEKMAERIEQSAFRLMHNLFRVGLFENAYCEKAVADELLKSDKNTAYAWELYQKSIAMLKNSAGIIKDNTATEEKATVYIPMVFTPASFGFFRSTIASWGMPIDSSLANKYFNVVTDTVGQPSGENGTYTENDIIRATDEELAEVDYAIVFASSPNCSDYDAATKQYLPISLQYGEYVADGEYVRTTSLAGDEIEVVIDSPYGAQTTYVMENRSYFGNTAKVSNAFDLDNILYAASRCENVVVALMLSKPMVFNEFETEVESIVVSFDSSETAKKALLEVIAGKNEPTGLLPLQMPANMDTVEMQYEDVPRDMECHVDSDGNTYDFAYGMNWSGVINDERVEKYAVEPLSN